MYNININELRMALTSGKKYSKELNKNLKALQRMQQNYDEFVATLLDKTSIEIPPLSDELKLLRELATDMMLTHMETYKSVYQICFSSYSIHRTLSEMEEFHEKTRVSEEVYSFTDGTSIYVRLPLLNVSVNSDYDTGKTSKNAMAKANLFSDSVFWTLYELHKTDYPVFENMSYKSIDYLFVYPQYDRFLIDNDNHQTKPITDAVTSLLPGGDSPTTTHFSYRATADKLIGPATLITVSPRSDTILSIDSILEKWKNYEKNREQNPSSP